MTGASWSSFKKYSFFPTESQRFLGTPQRISETLGDVVFEFEKLSNHYPQNVHLEKISPIIFDKIFTLGALFEEPLFSEKSIDRQKVVLDLIDSLDLINKELGLVYKNDFMPLKKAISHSVTQLHQFFDSNRNLKEIEPIRMGYSQ